MFLPVADARHVDGCICLARLAHDRHTAGRFHYRSARVAKSAAVVHGWNEPGHEQRASLQIFMLELKPEQLARIVEAQESGELKVVASVEDCRGYLAGLSDPLDES